MKQYRYNDAIINIKGKINQEKIKEATKTFFKKIDRYRKSKLKGGNQNGDIKR